MQERRTTIRVDRLSRAQYCPTEDLVPRDGRLTDLSDRGAGLLAHETHRVGARLTVSFSLPEEDELLTATGVVHWSDARVRQGHWYPLGLEWLPMEETARHRLHTFLSRRAPTPPLQISGEKILGLDLRPLIVRIALVLGVLLVAGLAVWVFSLSQKNHALGEAVEQRNAMIRHVEQREQRLEQALAAAVTQLTDVSKAAVQFSQQTSDLETEVGRLSGEVERFQESYVRIREEREQLIDRMMALEQERVGLTERLSSIPALRLAIQEAIAARRSAQRQIRLQALTTRKAIDRQYATEGNRGFLVRNGQPTATRSTVWIRVYDPEPLLTQSP
ncbi:MAG: PilZ domain-containing protein [Candidatus Omnitrophota bacterium]|nr:PilZ domain-containing protein [Candidatus Omnitrophota bacterium]